MAEHRGVEDVRKPVVIEIAEVRTHTRNRLTRLVISNAGSHRLIGKCPIAIVMQQQIGVGIVRHEDVSKSVAIIIRERYTHPLADILPDVRRSRHVGESPVAIVAIQDVRRALKIIR